MAKLFEGFVRGRVQFTEWAAESLYARRGGGLGSRPIFKKFHETYAPS